MTIDRESMATGPRENSGAVALFNVIKSGKVRAMIGLLDSGVEVNQTDPLGQTPLMHSVHVTKEDIRTQMVRLLLDHGADVNIQDPEGKTALMIAAFEKDREDVVRRIIKDKNCDPNVQDRKGDTVLAYAIYGGNSSVVRTLVNSSYTKSTVKVHHENSDGHDALIIAYKLKQKDCVKILIEEGGADICRISDKVFLSQALNTSVGGIDTTESNDGLLPSRRLERKNSQTLGDGTKTHSKGKKSKKKDKSNKFNEDQQFQRRDSLPLLRPLVRSPSLIKNSVLPLEGLRPQEDMDLLDKYSLSPRMEGPGGPPRRSRALGPLTPREPTPSMNQQRSSNNMLHSSLDASMSKLLFPAQGPSHDRSNSEGDVTFPLEARAFNYRRRLTPIGSAGHRETLDAADDEGRSHSPGNILPSIPSAP